MVRENYQQTEFCSWVAELNKSCLLNVMIIFFKISALICVYSVYFNNVFLRVGLVTSPRDKLIAMVWPFLSKSWLFRSFFS